MDRYNGILPVCKDGGMTSHDVIYKLRRVTGARKVGHTGTLDPMASGLLLISFGRATKLTQFLTEWDKTYQAEITLGITSDTLDGDGTLSNGGAVPDITESELNAVLERFTGRITQKVPAYSAVKVEGRELYKYARKGEEVEPPSRQIEIKELKLESLSLPRVSVCVRCSKGTYIRTLAADIGDEIGCGGYLSALIRRHIGPFDLGQALTLTQVEGKHSAGNLEKNIIPIEQVIDFPVINIRNEARKAVKNGAKPSVMDIIGHRGDFRTGDLLSMADELGEIVAIARSKCNAATFKSDKNADFFSYVRVLI